MNTSITSVKRSLLQVEIAHLPLLYTVHLVAPPALADYFLDVYDISEAANYGTADFIATLRFYAVAQFQYQLELRPLLRAMLNAHIAMGRDLEPVVSEIEVLLKPRIASAYMKGIFDTLAAICTQTDLALANRLMQLLADPRWDEILETDYRLHVHVDAKTYLKNHPAPFDLVIDASELTATGSPCPTPYRGARKHLQNLHSYDGARIAAALRHFTRLPGSQLNTANVDIHMALGLLDACHFSHPHTQRAIGVTNKVVTRFLLTASEGSTTIIAYALIELLGTLGTGLDYGPLLALLERLLASPSQQNMIRRVLQDMAANDGHPLSQQAADILASKQSA